MATLLCRCVKVQSPLAMDGWYGGKLLIVLINHILNVISTLLMIFWLDFISSLPNAVRSNFTSALPSVVRFLASGLLAGSRSTHGEHSIDEGKIHYMPNSGTLCRSVCCA